MKTDQYRCLNSVGVGGHKPRDAWGETRSDWKPELLYGAVGSLLSIGALSLSGWPESHLLSYGIPIVSGLLAALLVPFVQFLWKLLWQPWESLKDGLAEIQTKLDAMASLKGDIAEIGAKLDATTSTIADEPTEAPIDARLTALNYVRSYDDMSQTGLFTLRRAESIQRWTDEVVRFLAKHVSSGAAERILTAAQDERRDLLAEIAEELR